jgi:hypothetical protein
MQTRCFKNVPRVILAIAFASVVSACAHTPGARSSNQWQSTAAVSSSMQPELQQFLQNASGQSTDFFELTPWGENAEVTVQSRYYAGSGRECLRLQVTPETNSIRATNSQIAIACKQNNRQWVAVRPVAQLLNAR